MVILLVKQGVYGTQNTPYTNILITPVCIAHGVAVNVLRRALRALDGGSSKRQLLLGVVHGDIE